MIVQGLKVLLVEDSSVLAERMVEFMSEIPEIDLIGIVDSEAKAVAVIKKRQIHVVLLDLCLKQGSGFGILRAITSMNQKPQVVVFTNHDSPEYRNAASALGARHFLDKAHDFHRLPQILREIVGSGDGRESMH